VKQSNLISTPFDIFQEEENVAEEKMNFYPRVQSTSESIRPDCGEHQQDSNPVELFGQSVPDLQQAALEKIGFAVT
jgi:hypothetical protein